MIEKMRKYTFVLYHQDYENAVVMKKPNPKPKTWN